jgi:type IV pilus assembly protein PilA
MSAKNEGDACLMISSNKSGFTLVELMLVAIIVAILAAVAIPLMMRNRQRAMITEAESGLGLMRSALRAMYAESRAYNQTPSGDTLSAGSAAADIPGIQTGDLDGRYFDDDAYSISAIGAESYTLTADGDDSGAVEAAEVAGITITLDEDGEITRSGL